MSESSQPSRFAVSVRAGLGLGVAVGVLNASLAWRMHLSHLERALVRDGVEVPAGSVPDFAWGEAHVFLSSTAIHAAIGLVLGAVLGLWRARRLDPATARGPMREEVVRDMGAIAFGFVAAFTVAMGASLARETRAPLGVVASVAVGLAVIYALFRLGAWVTVRLLGTRPGRAFLGRPPWRVIGAVLGVGLFGLAGVRALLAPAPPPPADPAGTAPAGAPDVVVILIDTTRADRFTTYGYERPTTPAMDALGAAGVVFERAVSAGNWTVPSHASLLTGAPTAVHGAGDRRPRLGAGLETLPEILGRHGYRTIGITNNPLFSGFTGMTRGFQTWEDHWRTEGHPPVLILDYLTQAVRAKWRGGKNAGGADVSLPRLLEWMDGADETPGPDGGRRPVFAFVNLLEPHTTLGYHEGFTDDFMEEGDDPRELRLTPQTGYALARVPEERKAVDYRRYEALYDGELRFADHHIGLFVEGLRERGRLDETLLVITSDHGSGMGEHGLYSHGRSLYDELARVPLILHHPSLGPPRRIERPVQVRDLFPTILRFVGIDEPLPPGAVLVHDLLEGPRAEQPWDAVSEEENVEMFDGLAKMAPQFDPAAYGKQRRKAVYKGTLKYIRGEDGSEELYDLAADPGEQRDLAGERPGDLARLSAALDAWLASLPDEDVVGGDGEGEDLDPATENALRQLGYIE